MQGFGWDVRGTGGVCSHTLHVCWIVGAIGWVEITEGPQLRGCRRFFWNWWPVRGNRKDGDLSPSRLSPDPVQRTVGEIKAGDGGPI